MVFGIHSILQIVMMIAFLIILLRIPWHIATVAILVTSIILGLSEGLFVPFLALVSPFELEQILLDPWLRIMFTLPHLLLLSFITYLVDRRQQGLPLIGKMMKNSDNPIQLVKNHSLSQKSLLILCLVQALMLALLKISFEIYRSGVYPSLTLDTLVQISSLVLLVAVLTTVFVANYLLNTVEREARLTAELRYVKERHNLNLRLQIERHDFYNHLTAVYGYLKAKHYAAAEGYIQNLYKTIRHIESLLKLNPPELAALISVKQEEAKVKGIDFYWNINIEGENLSLSPEDLTHLVGNLLDNALEAAETARPPKVELIIVCDKMGLKLKVSNSGKLIPQDVKHNIFDAGYTTKNKNMHSGLGLYIIRQIIERYNGYLELKEPENYQGVEFIICIPWSSQTHWQNSGFDKF